MKKIYMNINDFDTLVPHSIELTIVEEHEDHKIAKDKDSIMYWIDEDNADMITDEPLYEVFR